MFGNQPNTTGAPLFGGRDCCQHALYLSYPLAAQPQQQNAAAPGTAGGLFGGSVLASLISPYPLSLGGQSQQNTAPTGSTGFSFGSISSQPQQSTGTNLFGTPSNTGTAGSGLFGTPSTEAAKPTAPLFGTMTTQSQSPFGTTTSNAPSATGCLAPMNRYKVEDLGLFASTAAPPTANLFGTQPQQSTTTAGGLFGGKTYTMNLTPIFSRSTTTKYNHSWRAVRR